MAEGHGDRAAELVQGITDAQQRHHVATTVVRELLAKGDPDAAERVTACIAELSLRAEMLTAVAEGLCRQQRLGEAGRVAHAAEAAARGVAGWTRRAESLAALAGSFAAAGHRDQAQLVAAMADQLADRLPNAARRGPVLVNIATALTVAGNSERARQIATGLPSRFQQSLLLAAVADAQIATGALDDARRTARTIPRSGLRREALGRLVSALAWSERRPHAEALALTLTGRPRTNALISIIAAPGAAEDPKATPRLAGLVRAAADHQPPAVRADTLVRLAVALRHAGLGEESTDVAVSAAAIARTLTADACPPLPALTLLAQALEMTSQPDEARTATRTAVALARRIPKPARRAGALIDLVKALANVAAFDHAEAVAAQIDLDAKRGQALAALTQALVHVGDLYRAERCALSIPDPNTTSRSSVRSASSATSRCRVAAQSASRASGVPPLRTPLRFHPPGMSRSSTRPASSTIQA